MALSALRQFTEQFLGHGRMGVRMEDSMGITMGISMDKTMGTKMERGSFSS
jgi:hypothetical protein